MNISRNFIKSISLATIMLLSFASFSAEKQSVTVKIEFNGARENIIQKVEFDKNISALEALLYVAKVQTHPIQGYVFVDIINDAPNVKGKKAWYYKINNEFAKQLAINQPLKNGDVVEWIYKQDVCSKTNK